MRFPFFCYKILCTMSRGKIFLPRLTDISSIYSGYPFRGRIDEDADGETAVVQIKNVDAETGVDWENLARTRLTGRREPDLLRKDDILFIAQGMRNIAACVDEIAVDAVCSPHFFMIRLKCGVPLLPAFLAWQINQIPAQRYLTVSATGSHVTGIRRQVLENLPVSVPDMKKQEKIVDFHEMVVWEKKLLLNMIENRDRQMRAVATATLAEQTEDRKNE